MNAELLAYLGLFTTVVVTCRTVILHQKLRNAERRLRVRPRADRRIVVSVELDTTELRKQIAEVATFHTPPLDGRDVRDALKKVDRTEGRSRSW